MKQNNILTLKQAIGAGARANKYRVNFRLPEAIPKDIDESVWDVLCTSTSIPGKNLGNIELWNQGRKLSLPGDTSYEGTITLTFYNTEEHNVRRAFLEWMRCIDDAPDNMHSGVPSEVLTDIHLFQLDSAGNPTVEYTLKLCYPSAIGSLSVDDSTADTITTTEVTLTYSYFVVGHGELDKPLEYNYSTRNWIS